MPKADPRTPSPPTSSSDTKPYTLTSPGKTKTSPAKPGKSPQKDKALIKRWTRQDKIDLLLGVIKAANVGKVTFEGIAEGFEGRTRDQCYDQWRQIILPALTRDGSVESTGKK